MNWIDRWFYTKKKFVFGGIQHLKILKLKKIISESYTTKVRINRVVGVSRRNKYESHRFILYDFKGFPRVKIQTVFNDGPEEKIIEDRYIEIGMAQILHFNVTMLEVADVYCEILKKNKFQTFR